MTIARSRAPTYTVCMNTNDTDREPHYGMGPRGQTNLRKARRQENLRKRFVRETEQLIIAAVEGF
jgi:hypothetical protein